MPEVRTAGGRCTVRRLPNFLGWVDLLTHGAPLARTSRACELRYKMNSCRVFTRVILFVIVVNAQIVPVGNLM